MTIERYLSGDASLLKLPCVAIVGSRKASYAGLARASCLAIELAQHGVVVVSGLAKGIDCAAHVAATEAGGRTIGVIGTALHNSRTYPIEHKALQARMARDHLVISPFEKGPQVNFPLRNMLIAELCQVGVVIEAQDNSGSLHVPNRMLRDGRPVFFSAEVLTDTSLLWPRRLMAKGAVPLQDPGQVLKALKREREAAAAAGAS